MEDYRKLLLQFIGSLTLCDHMGDVADGINLVLKKLGIEIGEWYDYSDLRKELDKMGVTTLYGTALDGDDNEDDDDIDYE